MCVKGWFSVDPGAILICDGDVAGIFTDTNEPHSEFNIFTDVSRFNDWIDEKFKAAVNHELPVEEMTTEVPEIFSDDPKIRK